MSRELFRIGKTQDSKYGRITAYTTPKTQGISLNFSNSTGKTIIRIEFDLAHYLHYHCPMLLPTRAHIPLAPIIDSIIYNNVIDNWSD